MNVRIILLEFLTILSSFSTLVCCALPAALVSIGAGAALASIVTVVLPQLVWLSGHKIPLFVFAGLMLALSGFSAYRNRNAPCPTDPAQATSCMRLRRWSGRIFCFSAAIYAIGFFFAFFGARLVQTF
jgi:hypothetical protein